MADTVSTGFRSLAPDTRPEPRSAFDHALKALLDDVFAAEPVWATRIGFHAYDDRWPDHSDSGRQARLSLINRHRDALRALADSDMTRAEQIDRGVVLEALDAMEFDETELREPAWDPMFHVGLMGAGLFALLAREFAPWQHRAAALAGRLRGLRSLVDASIDGLTGVGDRPVSLLHVETALKQASGIRDLISQAVAEGERQAEGMPAHAALADELRAAANEAHDALSDFERRLRDDIAPRAHGDGRLGADLFGKKLRHTLASELTPDQLSERARRDYELVRAEMLRLAREVWTDWLPGQQLPDSDDETMRRALDAVAREHRQPDELLEFSRAEVARIEEFCRAHNVMALPDEPLQVTWTPVFMRAYGRAFLEAPGVLDKGLSSYFWITPPDEAAGPEAVESYLREDNDRMLRLLAIHEGVPGHYLQGAYANRTSTLARAIFSSGLFAEGWAVYVTQVMMDLGYGDHEPALLLNHWKFYLRAITNALMDVAIHAEGMTEEQAMDMMVGGGFQERDEARAKWLRARLTSTQLSTYYVGSLEMWDMEVEARRRAAMSSGEGGAESVPEQHIAGGLSETPGFDYRAHLEAVVSQGEPPIKWIRRALFSEGW